MKCVSFLAILLMLLSCGEGVQVSNEEGVEYWGTNRSEKTPRRRHLSYMHEGDTIVKITNYYESGKRKSRIKFENDRLAEIYWVLDTNGKKVDFGNFKNGTGYVREYNTYDGKIEREGRYHNGNREGWWKKYHFTGVVIDSTFYENGFPKVEEPKNDLETLLDAFGPMKNNLYH